QHGVPRLPEYGAIPLQAKQRMLVIGTIVPDAYSPIVVRDDQRPVRKRRDALLKKVPLIVIPLGSLLGHGFVIEKGLRSAELVTALPYFTTIGRMDGQIAILVHNSQFIATGCITETGEVVDVAGPWKRPAVHGFKQFA